MGLFDKLFKKEETKAYGDDELIAPCQGKLVTNAEISDPVFAENMMGKTIGFEPSEGTIVAPCNGKMEAVFPTGHAFGIRMNDGAGILVHVGIDTVSMNGDGFKVFKKQGESVKAGEKDVVCDLKKMKEKGLAATTMLIVTEPAEGKEYNFIDPQEVSLGQKVNK